jgi:hypothetical protein
MKTLERAARRFRIEGAGWRLMRAKIVDQGAGDGCLTNATFIGANENNGWSGHGATLQAK